MKINFGDISIVIEPGDDPRQVLAIASAFGHGSGSAGESLEAARAVVEDAHPARRVKKCPGRDKCDGLFHYSEAKRHNNFMCETYEYVASFKHGRTSTQVADWCGISTSCAYHRLHQLTALGLLVNEGRVYVAAS